MTDRTAGLAVDGIADHLHCPRRYELARIDGLDDEPEESPTTGRLDVFRRSLCDAFRTGATEADALEAAAIERLGELWADHDERVHSRAQRRHERRVLEATARAYVDAVGEPHAAGIAELEETAPGDAFLGPSLPLSASVSLPERERRVPVDASVDYVYAEGSSLVGVRLVPTLRSLGLLRYRDRWEGDVADRFDAHFDPGADEFAPGLVGALFETSVVLDGLRELRDRLELTAYRTCRYVQIPVADRSRVAVNWLRDTVETTLEPCDLTDPFIDHHTFGMTHQHRNETVETRLSSVAGSITRGEFHLAERWDRVREHACPDCAYTVCCPEYIAEEVRFDG